MVHTELHVGNTVVDLRLPRELTQGQRVDAAVHVRGGDEAEAVAAVHAAFDVAFARGSPGDPDALQSIGHQRLIEESFVVEPHETGAPVDEDEDEDEDRKPAADGDDTSEGADEDDDGESGMEDNDGESGMEDNDGESGEDGFRWDRVEEDEHDPHGLDAGRSVTLVVPEAAPVTRPQGEGFPAADEGAYPTVAVETSMDGEFAVTPQDEDAIEIDIGGRFEVFHRAVTDHLGFELARVGCGTLPGLKNWTQRFEYEPSPGSRYEGEYDELEADLDYTHDGPGLGLEIQFDPVDSVPLELGESYDSFVVDDETPERVAAALVELAD